MSRPTPAPAALPRLARVAAVLLPLGAACSSGNDPKPNGGVAPLTTAEAGVVAGNVFGEAYAAMFGGAASGRGDLRASRASLVPALRNRLAASTSTQSFNGNCQLGGTVSGMATFTSPDDGGGVYAGAVTFVPHACVVSTGTRNVAVDGDPSLTMTWTDSTDVNGVGSATFRVDGGFQWSGQRCAVDYTIVLDASDRLSVTGRVCGEDVSGTY